MPKKSKVSEERIAELVKMLQIPESIKREDYPPAMLRGRDNIFLDISTASRVWRKVDHGVSERIFEVINSNCKSDTEVDALLNYITL